jgi:periplasmic copper chaperone A
MLHLARTFRRYGLAAAGAAAVCQLIAGHAVAADYDVGPMHITQPWSRATPKGASAAAGYLTVTNTGSTPDRLNCVSSDVAGACQIHSMTMENGVMKMRPVEGGLEIKPGETVTLKPGSFHIMFVDLKHPLEQGKSVEATVKFDQAGTVQIALPVLALGAPAPNAASGGTMGGSMMQGGGTMMQMDKH